MSLKKNIREIFKNEVFKRDNYTCQVCGVKRPTSELNAHHITDRHLIPNGGYVKTNGITVCEEICHLKVEKFHITEGKEWEENLHPDDLYKKIKSSKQQAIKDSENLK